LETARWRKSFELPAVAPMRNLEQLLAIASGKVHGMAEASHGRSG
jgi:hypothetical protein